MPSDSPDDYAALNDIQTKADYFLKTFNVKPEWAASFKPVPIINVPDFGDLSAIKACQQFKVKSQKDRQLLDQAKDLVYTKGTKFVNFLFIFIFIVVWMLCSDLNVRRIL